MKLYFSPKTTLICTLLALGMIRASFWQWQRHLEKQHVIKTLEARLEAAPVPLVSLVQSPALDWTSTIHSRVLVEGSYDFTKEMVLRNRRYQEMPGVYVLTPLKLKGSESYVIVNRGFLPLSRASSDARREFQSPADVRFTGLVKESSTPLLLAPQDPEAGPELPWVDAWLRVDLQKIQRQLSYKILPISLEIMDGDSISGVTTKITTLPSGRDEMFLLESRSIATGQDPLQPGVTYPIPVFDVIIPPGRHLGYVWEWGLMAFVTALIGIVLQLRPRKRH